MIISPESINIKSYFGIGDTRRMLQITLAERSWEP